MPSRFLQAIGVDLRSDEEREARGRAVRASRHSSRVTLSRHRSTKLRTKERNKSGRSLMSVTTGSESERRSRKKSSVRSNSGKKRSPKRREETEMERLARRRERKDEKERHRDESVTGEVAAMEDSEPVPSIADEEPTSAGLGISTLCDIPQQQAVDVFAFQSDWSDDEDVGEASKMAAVPSNSTPGQYEDHPAEYEDATDGHETDHQGPDEHIDMEHLADERPSDFEKDTQERNEKLHSTVHITSPPSQPSPHFVPPPPRSLAASVVDETDDVPTPIPQDFSFNPNRTVSSGSSFASTQFSETHDDAETERSTSPETSFKSPSPIHASPQNQSTPTQPEREEIEDQAQQTPSASRLAAQTLAAEQRQKTIRRRSSHHSRRPEMPRHYPSLQQPYQNPWILNQPQPSLALSPIPPYSPSAHQLSPHIPTYPPAPSPAHAISPHIPLDAQGHPPPLTGYAALATALSPHSPTSRNTVFQPAEQLPPLYRRFTTLNHRLLLHLQDELAELEDSLTYLDSLDTVSRTHRTSTPNRRVIRPASRREGAMSGSELEWRKADILARIAAKLQVYNKALAGFERTEQMRRAGDGEVERYTAYLGEVRVLVEGESGFLGKREDLVSLASGVGGGHVMQEEDVQMRFRARLQRRLTATAHGADEQIFADHGAQVAMSTRSQLQQTLCLSALLSVIVPMLTFHIIPNFVGRMVVAFIVALGVLMLINQNGAGELLALGRREKRVVAGVWVGGMVVLALIA